jgi:hypothetical protein
MAKALLHELGKSLSYGRLTLRAKVLWPMLLASSDDQGRGLAEADSVKWYVCPNVPEIAIDDVPALFSEMAQQGMIVTYDTDRGLVYQIVRWWEYQSLQWARPSKYDAPEGWTDRIRYSNRGDCHACNWDTCGGFDAQPREEPQEDDDTPQENEPETVENQVENYVDNQPNLTQPNLTQSNLTDKNHAPSGAVEKSPENQGDLELFYGGDVPEQRERSPVTPPEPRDAVADIVEQAAKRQRDPLWWLKPGTFCGDHNYLEPYRAFCGVIRRDPSLVGEHKTKKWLAQFEKMAVISPGGGDCDPVIIPPGIMADAIKAIRDDWNFQHRRWTTPFSNTFRDAVELVAAQLMNGQNVDGAPPKQPIVVSVPTGDPGWMIKPTPEMAAARERARRRVESGVF